MCMDNYETFIRLAAFRREHPAIGIATEFGTWQAIIPEPDGERCLAGRRTLNRLLDDLENLLAGPSG